MKKYFNTAGPCNPNKHYILSSQNRCKGIMDLIEQEQYFVIHAAPQSGKTTLLLELAEQLNNSGEYFALYCSLESVQGINDPENGIPAIVKNLKKNIRLNNALKEYGFAQKADYSDISNVLENQLIDLCQKTDKPLVILFDEVDCLSNGTLIMFLRQLRSAYVTRSTIPFVNSICLTGMRNIRDYKARVREDSQSLGSASPFNIVEETFNLKNFSLQDITELYAQHTQQTGQKFPKDVVERIYYYTQGQPWLINALPKHIVTKILGSDFSKPVLLQHADQAVNAIIDSRAPHIDSLLERLKEERVKKIIQPLIMGEDSDFDPLDDDYQYVVDLGLIRETDEALTVSNPIYSDVITRFLGSRSQLKMKSIFQSPDYIKDNRLDMKKLLTDFQQFWRRNSEIWVEQYKYKEAAPHLILQAFLYKIINHGGRITREMAAGRRRLDLCVHYKGYDYPVELKIRHDEQIYEEGKEQLADYIDKLGCDKEGWLVVFDRREDVSWDTKIFWKTVEFDDKVINIVGA
jgi:hypothetical protein